MIGFPLRTVKRNTYCVKCGYYFARKKHTCAPPESYDFERVRSGSEQYKYLESLFKAADYIAWVGTRQLQIARIRGTDAYYLVLTSFGGNYSASLLNCERLTSPLQLESTVHYIKLRPRHAVGSLHTNSILYVNDDFSAAMIPLSVFEEDE
jgi:hypothetical protein